MKNVFGNIEKKNKVESLNGTRKINFPSTHRLVSLHDERQKRKRELVSGQRTNQQKFLKAFQASYGREREAEKSFPFSFAALTERKSTNFPTIELRNDLRRVNSSVKVLNELQKEACSTHIAFSQHSTNRRMYFACFLQLFHCCNQLPHHTTTAHNFSSQKLFRSCDFLLIVYQFCITALTISSLPPWHT